MRSTFGALLRYARSDKKQAVEDFSTEALAGALRTDFWPIVPLLRQHGLFASGWEPLAAEIHTQKPVPGGRVDLAITFLGPGTAWEVWLEVKVAAALGVGQPETYLRAIAERDTHLRTELGLLLKAPFRTHPEIPRLYWREVRDVANACDRSAVLWRDLGMYLEEEGVTDPYDDPIRPSEAAAMLEAATLLRKMRRLLRRTAREARMRWPTLHFPDRKGVADRYIEEQFADHARLTIGTRGGRADICFGLAQREIASGFYEAEPQVVVWVEHPPNLTDVRHRLITTANANGLGDEWVPSWKGYWALRRHVSSGEFADLAAMRDWWWARLEELEQAGIVALISQLGAPTPEELADAAQEKTLL